MLPESSGAGVPANEGVAEPKEIAASAVGYVDILDERRVAGWAWCRSRPELPVEVEFRLDGRVLQRVVADRFRHDLARCGAGDGCHAFDIRFDPPLEPEQKQRFAAFVVCGPDGPFVPMLNSTVKVARESPGSSANVVPAPSPAVADLKPVISALSSIQKSVEQSVGNWRVELRADLEAAMNGVHDQLATLASSMDILQTRVDTVCATLHENAAVDRSSRQGDRTLTLVVAGLGVVSCASLVLGLIAVLG